MLNQPTPPNSDSDRKYYMFAIRIVGDFGASLAVPVVLFAWLGKTADTRFHTTPYLLILGFVIAALSSTTIIYRKAKRYGQQYQNLTK